MTPKELRSRGELGFIPGPEETEDAFVKRVHMPSPELSLAAFPSLNAFMKKKLGLTASWVGIHYSKKSLMPWEGAVLFTEKTAEGVYKATIQLRKGFKKKRHLFYDRDEVLLHESIHALRVAFEEPRFEEMMAYHFSKSPLRRFLGPLFSTPKQSYLFLGALLFSLWNPLILPVYLLIRGSLLLRDHRTFGRALKKIQTFFPNIPLFRIVLCLTDKEIELFANQDEEEISAYLLDQKDDLRWQQVL